MSRMRQGPVPPDAIPPHRPRLAQLERSCERTEAVLRRSAELMVLAKSTLGEAERALEYAWVLRDRLARTGEIAPVWNQDERPRA